MTPILLLWLLIAIAHDGRERRIRNSLVLVGMAMALLALAIGLQPFDLTWSEALLGAAAGFAGLIGFYALGVMGAGDVKFATALGLWVGWQALLPIWAVASALAGVHSLLLLALQRWPCSPRLALALSGRPADNGRRTRPIPFAAYLAVATLVHMAWHAHG